MTTVYPFVYVRTSSRRTVKTSLYQVGADHPEIEEEHTDVELDDKNVSGIAPLVLDSVSGKLRDATPAELAGFDAHDAADAAKIEIAQAETTMAESRIFRAIIDELDSRQSGIKKSIQKRLRN